MMQQQQQYQQKTPGDKSLQYGQSISLPLDLVGGTAFGRYQKISNEQTYNMIISDGALVPFAGYDFIVNIAGSGEARAVYNSVIFNHIIAVVGNGVFTISTSYAVQRVGSLTSQAGDAFIADNQAGQIAITDGQFVYIFNYNASSFQQITVDFAPGRITYQDTYFICPDLNTNQWRLSGNNDGTTWPPDAQHVGELQSKPSKALATVALDRILLVFGQTVCEPWYDSPGAQLFPYVRNSYYVIDYGLVSTDTIASGFGMVVWLASNEKSGFAIMVSQEGSPPNQISNDGLDFLFSHLTNPADSYGFLIKLDGHIFYVLTFVTDNHTYAYDFNTQKFFTLTDEKLNYFIAKKIVYFNGDYYFVSFHDANLYKLSSEITTYNGRTIPRYRIGKNIRFTGADRFIVQNMNITMESGISTGYPHVNLSISNDGGYAFSHIGSQRLPLLGRRKNILPFYNLGGIENDFVWKFEFLAQGRIVVVGGSITLYR